MITGTNLSNDSNEVLAGPCKVSQSLVSLARSYEAKQPL